MYIVIVKLINLITFFFFFYEIIVRKFISNAKTIIKRSFSIRVTLFTGANYTHTHI